MNRSEIVEKIRKLIAHEQSARSIGNLAEAEAFAAKIQALMLDYKLSVDDVELQADPLGDEQAAAARPARSAQTWSYRIAAAVARAFFCRAISHRGSNAVTFAGRSMDRAMAADMWRFLTNVATSFFTKDLPALKKLRRNMSPHKLRDRYLQGFAIAIASRLARDREVVVENLGEPGLIRLNEERVRLDNYIAGAMRIKSTAIKPVRDSLALRAGFNRGMATPLRKQHELGGGAA